MNRPGLTLAFAAALVLAGAAAIRFWPPVPGWHEDPATVTPPAAANHWLLRDSDGDAPALRLPQPPEAVAAKLAQVAAATPRTRVLAGGGLRTTWLTRSRLVGYPDTTSVLIRPDGAGSEVLIYARSRLGGHDWGVSRARAEAWAAALAAP